MPRSMPHQDPQAQSLSSRDAFRTSASPTLASLAAQMEQPQAFDQRWSLYRQIARQPEAGAVSLLADALGREKDTGIRYMTANLLRDAGSRSAEGAAIAARAIAKALAPETDAYAQRAMELSLSDIAAKHPQTAAVAAQAIAAALSKPADALATSLRAGQLADFCAVDANIGTKILPAVAEAFAAAPDKLSAHHLSRVLSTIASDDTQRPQVIAVLMQSLTTAPSAAHPLEKTFAAAHALHRIAETAPVEVTQALATALAEPAQGSNARRLCILGLKAFAEAHQDCAKIAAPALVSALPQETDALHRRHIVDGVMTSVRNDGITSNAAGAALFAHLSIERDRETRDTINQSLRRLNHKTSSVPMSIPVPKP